MIQLFAQSWKDKYEAERLKNEQLRNELIRVHTTLLSEGMRVEAATRFLVNEEVKERELLYSAKELKNEADKAWEVLFTYGG